MGYPIHSNIFSDATKNSRWIRSFPIQVAVIFSPRDKIFKDAFREYFLSLDKLTGNDVIFFALLDPPGEWMDFANRREAWQDYWKQIPIGYNFNDPMLIYELTRQFDIQWDDLPVLVISTNLWTTEYLVSKTTPDHLESQLKVLTQLAQRFETDELDMGYIIERLKDSFGFFIEYHPADFKQRTKLSRFYNILETDLQQLTIPKPIFRDMINVYYTIQRIRSEFIPLLERKNYQTEFFDIPGIEKLLRDVTGQLIPYVAVNEDLISQKGDLFSNNNDRFSLDQVIADLEKHNELLDLLDDESFTMINVALRTGKFMDDPRFFEPILRGRTNRRLLEEYSQAGIELWKTFEREMNKSIVQAFRSARTIEMPQFFARFRPNFKGNGTINTPRKNVKINRKDWQDPNGTRHRYLTIGDGYHCADAMQGDPNEQFDYVIRGCLGVSHLPQSFMDDWQRIYQIRNPPSHSELLPKDEFIELANRVLNIKNLDVIVRIKKHLSK